MDGVNHDLRIRAMAPPVMDAHASNKVEVDVDKEERAKVTKPVDEVLGQW
mgnify:CR=1 FL=1